MIFLLLTDMLHSTLSYSVSEACDVLNIVQPNNIHYILSCMGGYFIVCNSTYTDKDY